MIILYLVSIIGVILFEVIFRQNPLLINVSLLFILVNWLYWNKRYRTAIIFGLATSIFIDLFLQDQLGRHVLAVFIPILVLTLIDGLLHIENRLSKIIYTSVSLNLAIAISDLLFNFVYFQSINLKAIFSEMLVSTIVLMVLGMILERILLSEEEANPGKVRRNYLR